MSPKLSERFEVAKGAPIEVDGQLVAMMHELDPIDTPTELRIELATTASRPQGLRLKVRGGVIELNGEQLDDAVLWSDTAPSVVTARLRPANSAKPMSVRLWNVWRDGAGTMQSWIGNAGMVVRVEGNGITLHCSDGFDAPSFDDLVATLTR